MVVSRKLCEVSSITIKNMDYDIDIIPLFSNILPCNSLSVCDGLLEWFPKILEPSGNKNGLMMKWVARTEVGGVAAAKEDMGEKPISQPMPLEQTHQGPF